MFMNIFHGEVKNIQIQQDNHYAVQIQSANEAFDYDGLIQVIEKIKEKENEDQFDKEYQETAQQVKELTEQIGELAKQKRAPEKIRNLLQLLKNLSTGAAGSLLASGILHLIEPFLN